MKAKKTIMVLAAGLMATAVLADTVRWTGSSGDWSEPANWTNEGSAHAVPAADDTVIVSSDEDVTISLSVATPAFASLTVGGGAGKTTVLVTAWDAALSAADVHVAANGVLTAQGAQDKANMGRVWIKATDVTVDKGGAIDVDGCGYASYEKGGGVRYGPGPGATYTYGVGASHGGLGGYNHFSISRPLFIPNPPQGAFGTLLYDDPEAPVEPGSSGMSSNNGRGGCGGGCVRIEASGRVTVNGVVSASGTKTTSYGGTGVGHLTGGSGGSIYITCQTFAGVAGAVRADGGGGFYALDAKTGGPQNYQDAAGGGGMIAIHYDTSAQMDGLVKDMTISALPGLYKTIHNWKGKIGLSTLDKHYMEAELGTLSFSDGKLLESFGRGISGRIRGVSQWTCDSLVFTNGFVRFCGEGVKFTVTGDLVITGATARLDLGELYMTNRVHRKEVYVGKVKTELTVGGNLFIADDARLDIRAAETNAPGCWGAELTVGGNLTVGTNGNLYVWCETVNGGAPNVTVGQDFSVLEGGLVSAEKRGFAGGHNYSNGSTWYQQYWNKSGGGYGPGYGRDSSVKYWYGNPASSQTYVAMGGSHGGKGGWTTMTNQSASAAWGRTYDDPWLPAFPGSGGGCYGYAPAGGTGGGLIRVIAGGGLRVDGEINADGGHNWLVQGQSDSPSGAGAGGTIFLYGRTFSGAETGRLSAKGGNTTGVSASQGCGEGAGGGGRIAVWVGESETLPVKEKRLSKQTTPIAVGTAVFEGRMAVDGGINLDLQSPDVVDDFVSTDGKPGSVGFVQVGPPAGLMILFR